MVFVAEGNPAHRKPKQDYAKSEHIGQGSTEIERKMELQRPDHRCPTRSRFTEPKRRGRVEPSKRQPAQATQRYPSGNLSKTNGSARETARGRDKSQRASSSLILILPQGERGVVFRANRRTTSFLFTDLRPHVTRDDSHSGSDWWLATLPLPWVGVGRNIIHQILSLKYFPKRWREGGMVLKTPAFPFTFCRWADVCRSCSAVETHRRQAKSRVGRVGRDARVLA